jgi:hypothetical protein
LRLDTQGGDRPRIEPLQADRLSGLLAIAVGAVVESRDRGVDLGDQLALPVPCSELERPLGLGGGAVGDVGVLLRIIVEMLQRLFSGTQNLVAPGYQLVAEIGPLALAHERLVVRWPIIVRNFLPPIIVGILLLFLCPHESRIQTHPFRHWAKNALLPWPAR